MTETQNRELDAWVWQNIYEKSIRMVEYRDGRKKVGINFFPETGDIAIPSYSTDPAAAMEVLKKCVEKLDGYEVSVGLNQYALNEREKWMVCSTCRRGHQSISDSLETAICLFAKKLFSK